MTSQSKKYPTRVEVKHNGQIGWVIIDQIRTIDKQRMIKVLGELSDKEIIEVKNTIKEAFVE